MHGVLPSISIRNYSSPRLDALRLVRVEHDALPVVARADLHPRAVHRRAEARLGVELAPGTNRATIEGQTNQNEMMQLQRYTERFAKRVFLMPGVSETFLSFGRGSVRRKIGKSALYSQHVGGTMPLQGKFCFSSHLFFPFCIPI